MSQVLRIIAVCMLLGIGLNYVQAAQSGDALSYQLSSHVLDITLGQPAEQVKIVLSKQQNNANQSTWQEIAQGITDRDGRVKNFLPQQSNSSNAGIYKLTFYTADYFKSQNIATFYPSIEVIFKIENDSHYHVPITLSPFGYSTYRGS